MLFDLRSRRRRRAVKSVYVFLALLIGVGLIGFGVGSGGNFGGIFNAAGSGGGSGTGETALTKTLTRAQTRARQHPDEASAWAAVGASAYQLSQIADHYVSGSGYTKAGFQTLAVLESAWKRYLAILPANPDTQLANEVALVFGPTPTGIQHWGLAESAQELVVGANPTYSGYANLAYFAYNAHRYARGDLAAAKAVAMAPKKTRKQLKAELLLLKAEAQGKAGSTSSTGTSGSTSTSTSPSSTSTSSSHSSSSTTSTSSSRTTTSHSS